jgi:VanZ family protein
VIAYLTLTLPRLEALDGLLSDKAYRVIVFAAAIELVQPLVGRSAKVLDFVMDVVGVTCGLVLGFIARELRIKSLNDHIVHWFTAHLP